MKKPTPQEISDAKARLASSVESFDRESASLLKEAIGLDAVGLCDRKAAIEAIAASIIADAQTCGMRSKAKDRIEAVYALRPQVDLFLDAQTCGKGGK